jgi:hypothetical protein
VHFDPNASDDEVLRAAGYPRDPATMSDEDKKAVADEIRAKARESISPEFTEEDIARRATEPDAPAPYQRYQSPSTQSMPWGYVLLLACIAAAGIYWFLRPGPSDNVVELPKPAGWDELEPCSVLDSLDETKEMTLSDNQAAKVEDVSSPGDKDHKTIEGAWSYDAGSKRYAITLNGETTTYTLLARGEPTTCILFKGDIHAADLSESWFSFPSYDDYEPER